MASSSIDKQKKQPIYQQIVTHFIEEIQAGTYGPGDRLPPERSLAQTFDVNRSTVVKALDELKRFAKKAPKFCQLVTSLCKKSYCSTLRIPSICPLAVKN